MDEVAVGALFATAGVLDLAADGVLLAAVGVALEQALTPSTRAAAVTNALVVNVLGPFGFSGLPLVVGRAVRP